MAENVIKKQITIEAQQQKIPDLDFLRVLGIPIYVVSSQLLSEAYMYLIEDNPVGKFPPLYDDARLERIVGLAGLQDGEIRTIDTLLFPEMTLQTTTQSAARYGRLLIELDKEGRVHHGRMHNHNSKYGWKQNPTPPDVELHETWEQSYGPQLTVIVSEDGSFGFWRPTDYKVFVDGKELPYLTGPNLRPNIRGYTLP